MYLCTEAHTSAADLADGLELDETKWDIFANGMTWRNVWTATSRYRTGDVVRYGGQVYVCNTGHTAADTDALGLEDDQAKWDYVHKGIVYLGDWTTSTRYKINDVVKYGSDIWICTAFHTSGATLAADEANWSIFVPGLEFEDSWQNNVNYQPGDVVTYGGYSYVAITNNYGQIPFNNPTHWDLFTTGFTFRGDYDNNYAYKIGDVVRLGGWTFIALADGTGNRPPDAVYWDKLNEGLYWKGAWQNAVYYDKGDVVRGINDVNSYVCIAPHTSEQVGAGQNRPDQDIAGNFWNLLSGGAEVGNLTTLGDLVYYSGSGPTRLPVGSPGQVLKVNSAGNAPEWAYFGQLDAVYYVSPEGEDNDAPAAGVTLDKPFKTVQFGLQQIEKGARNPYATRLLRRNKAFIVAETIAWVDTQVINSSAPFTGSFTYTASNWKRDLRFLLDAVEWDLSHGGNRKVRQVAYDFFRVNSSSSYVTVDGITAEFAATLAYIKTLIDDVITQDTPATDYQTARSVSPLTLQVTDSTIVEEAAAQGIIENLIEIPRAALASNSATSTNFTVSDATYDPIEGTLEMTIGNHSLAINQKVILRDQGITFTCASDNHATPLAYPRATDPAYSTPLSIIGTTDIKITVNVGPSPETSEHLFVSALTNTVSLATGGGIPAEIVANDTLFLKTGQFTEVLPMVIPESCAVVGDELRSTRVQPAGSLIASADVPYSLAGILHMKSIVDDIILNNTVTAQSGNTVTQNTAYPAGDAAAVTKAEGVCDAIHNYIDWNLNSNGTNPTMEGQMSPNKEDGVVNAVLRLEENKDFIAEDVNRYIIATYPAYTDYISGPNAAALQASCKRDVRRYVEAIQHDIVYDSTYKAIRAAQLYVNSVNGSTLENMFFVRNGTGIRNMTLNGLNGTLGSANTYGTKRPTAGAYVSLDPGWGPAHEDVWVKNKSCYVQNVTNFGNGCTGLKIDGDLHAGGNDSVVANDFTQVLSDGIGVWCTNLGRTELVSVFSYYGHIGYLAENGGKIRATNGNSSYGTFGCVAEGVDDTEVPIIAFADNKAQQAVVSNVLTDGDRVLALEYTNAGREYDTNGGNAVITITGTGFQIGTVTPVTRTAGVMEVRLLNTNDEWGGADYVSAGNAAQIGNATSITISNTDTNSSGALVGMGIWLVAGLGAGQYGYIDTYNAGTKQATIRKYSDGSPGWDHILGEPILSLLDSTTTYSIEPRVTFSAPVGDGSSTSIRALGRARVSDGQIVEIKILEPGQGYDNTATVTITDPNNTVDAPLEIRIADGVLAQPTFAGSTNAGRGTGYETASADITATKIEETITGISQASPARVTIGAGHSITLDGTKVEIAAVTGMIRFFDATTFYAKVIDANNIDLYSDPLLNVPIDTTLEPAYTSGGTLTHGGGFMDRYQPGKYIQVSGLRAVPRAGSNIEFSGQPNVFYKLVAVTNLRGSDDGPFTAQLQISPEIPINNAPEHEEDAEVRIRYSQVRLTGHDFLDIGTGDFTNTNYPNLPLQDPDPDAETVEGGGGRVFYTSTDQDGNFRVGGLFNVEQSTGVATLNADAFNISGLQELSLGNIALGQTGATINEFSTDGTFAANSDSIVPTQRAIKTYITSQIGGGASTLNVNQIIAGLVQIDGQQITTTTVVPINVKAQFNFQGGINGAPVALNMFLMG